MLSKCANPDCSKRFLYFNEGRVFTVDLPAENAAQQNPGHNVEHFWLCGSCCASKKLVFVSGRGVLTVPLENWEKAA